MMGEGKEMGEPPSLPQNDTSPFDGQSPVSGPPPTVVIVLSLGDEEGGGVWGARGRNFPDGRQCRLVLWRGKDEGRGQDRRREGGETTSRMEIGPRGPGPAGG